MRPTLVKTRVHETVIVENPHMWQKWLKNDNAAPDYLYRIRTFHRIGAFHHVGTFHYMSTFTDLCIFPRLGTFTRLGTIYHHMGTRLIIVRHLHNAIFDSELCNSENKPKAR